MSQPKWKLIAQLGDKDPITYGGYFIYEDETGVYPPEAEWLDSPEEYEPQIWRVYRFNLDKCTYQKGILSDNPFHPDHKAWFADEVLQFADSYNMTKDEFANQFCSDDPLVRAFAYREVGCYHGFDKLDHYPLEFTQEEVERRYADEQEGRS